MKYLLVSLLLPLLFVSGCIQGQATVFLNPDGSGKIEIETVTDPCSIGSDAKSWQAYQGFTTQIKNSLIKSEGIDAWTDVDWRVLTNGKLYCKGEAYFKAIDDVVIYLGNLRCNLRTYLTNESGKCFLEIKSLKSELDEPRTTQRPNAAMRYSLFSADVEKMLIGLRLDLVFNLPGNTEKIQGFEGIDKRAVHYTIDGNRMKYLLDYVGEKGLYSLAERRNYNRAEFLNSELLPLYLDNCEPLRVFFTDDGATIFDYEKEKSKVKKDIIKIVDKLDAAAVIAKINQRNGKTEESEKTNSDTQEKMEFGIDEQLRRGLIFEAKEEYQQAIVIYSKIIDDKKSEAKYLAQAYYRKGICLFELGESDKAIKQFEYVIASFPSERIAAIRSSDMIRDIQDGNAVRKADMKKPDVSMITGSFPGLYADDVNSSGIESITVRFSAPMEISNWFYSSFAPGELPQIMAQPSFDASGRELTLSVKLEPGKVYAIAFNCGDAAKGVRQLKAGFRSQSGLICKPFVLVFATMDEDKKPTGIDEKLIKRSEIINLAE